MGLIQRYPVLRRVIVNLKGAEGQSFRGVLWRNRGGYLVLKNAAQLKRGGEAIPVDGELAIPRVNIAFLQVL